MSDFETEFARRNELSHALAMVHCLQDHFLEMRETAEKSLVRHLPKMVPGDRDWVDDREIRAMSEALHADRLALTVALLFGLSHVGDEKILRRIISFWHQVSASGHPNVASLRPATMQCIECLQNHTVQLKQARTLLRGSEEPPIPIDTILLRPAGDPATCASAELLRPGPLAPETESLKGIRS
jgi:hypothetical protein